MAPIRQTADQQIPELAQYQRQFLLAGAAGAVLSLVGLVLDPAQFYQSYLTGYLLVLGATLGCLLDPKPSVITTGVGLDSVIVAMSCPDGWRNV